MVRLTDDKTRHTPRPTTNIWIGLQARVSVSAHTIDPKYHWHGVRISEFIMQTTLYWFTAILCAIASRIDSGDRTQWNRSNHHENGTMCTRLDEAIQIFIMANWFGLWINDFQVAIDFFYWRRAWDEMRWVEITKSLTSSSQSRERANERNEEKKKRKCSLSVVALIRKNDKWFAARRRICM